MLSALLSAVPVRPTPPPISMNNSKLPLLLLDSSRPRRRCLDPGWKCEACNRLRSVFAKYLVFGDKARLWKQQSLATVRMDSPTRVMRIALWGIRFYFFGFCLKNSGFNFVPVDYLPKRIHCMSAWIFKSRGDSIKQFYPSFSSKYLYLSKLFKPNCSNFVLNKKFPTWFPLISLTFKSGGSLDNDWRDIVRKDWSSQVGCFAQSQLAWCVKF